MRFLQYFKIPSEKTQVDLLHDVLVKLLHSHGSYHGHHDSANGGDTATQLSSTNKSNAENSVLFEAVNLVILYGPDCPEELRETAVNLLGRFVGNSRDANLRYLAVDALTRLAKLDGPAGVEPFMPAIFDAMKDTDISLRRRALTLLFVMASERTARKIVSELVLHLPLAEPVMKEDVVVKVSRGVYDCFFIVMALKRSQKLPHRTLL